MPLSAAEKRVCDTLHLSEDEFVAAAAVGVTPESYRLAATIRDLTPEQLAAARALGLPPERYAAQLLAAGPEPTPEEARQAQAAEMHKAANASIDAGSRARLHTAADAYAAGDEGTPTDED